MFLHNSEDKIKMSNARIKGRLKVGNLLVNSRLKVGSKC